MKHILSLILIFFCSYVLTHQMACNGRWGDVEIEPMYPDEGWEVTDIALSFRWKHQIDKKRGAFRDFDLQVDDSSDFSSPEIDIVQSSPVNTYPEAKNEFKRWTQISYMPYELLPPGTYYWRVALSDTDEWSETISFTINDDHSSGTMSREISASSPLFSFDMFFDSGSEGLLGALPEIYQSFPESVQPYIAFALHNEPIGLHPEYDDGFDGSFSEFLQPFAAADVPILIKTGGPDKDFQQFVELSELEHIFKTQPNVIGLLEGETFWDFIDASPGSYEDTSSFYTNQVTWYRRCIQLAKKYGRYVVVGNGNDEYFAWDQYLGEEDSEQPWMQPSEILSAAANIIPTAKNNIPFGYYQAESAVMGAWLSGQTNQWGVWSEGWAWGSIGYGSLFGPQLVGDANDPDFSTMPYNLWIQMKLAALSQGASYYHFGGESSVVEWGEYDSSTGHFVISDDEVLTQSTAFWDMEGTEHPSLKRYILPFLEAVVEQDLIASKEEVLDKVKIAVASPSVETEKGSAMDYGIFGPMYEYIMGIDDYISIAEAESADEDADYYEMTPNACRRELLHNRGRYYMTPVLPYPIDSLEDGTTIVSTDEIASTEAVQSLFDTAYPQQSTGDAWVVRVGKNLYINNSHENTDEAQDFSVEIAGVGTLSGTIQPHSYLIATITEDVLWLFGNAGGKGDYTDDRTTRLELTLDAEPSVSGDGSSTWSNGVLSLSLDQSSGASETVVEFTD
jgi:hypothetical protein